MNVFLYTTISEELKESELVVDETNINSIVKKLESLYTRILPEKKCIPDSVEDVEISLSVITASEIKKVNAEYRDVDNPTDVLSFPLWENEEGVFVPPVDWDVLPLGDLLICLEEVQKNAIVNKKTFEEELVLIISHGLLHLIGRDHDTDEKKESMWAEQDKIVEEYIKDKTKFTEVCNEQL